MADTDERDTLWGEHTARLTFLWTIVGAALFAAVVFVFVLR